MAQPSFEIPKKVEETKEESIKAPEKKEDILQGLTLDDFTEEEINQLSAETIKALAEKEGLKATPEDLDEFGLEDTLPFAGSVAGEVLGGPLGAGIGGGAGSLVESGIEKIQGVDRSLEDVLGEAGKEFALGITGAKFGQLLGKGLSKTSKFLTKRKPDKEVEAIIKASDELGIPVSEGQLTRAKFIQQVQDVLNESGTQVGGLILRPRIERITNGLSAAAETVIKPSEVDKFANGLKIKNIIADRITSISKELSPAFEAVTSRFDDILVNKQETDLLLKAIQEDATFRTSGNSGKRILGELKSFLDQAKTLGDIKLIRTNFRKSLSGVNASDLDYQLVNRAYEKITNFRNAKALVEIKATQGPLAAQRFVDEVKSADKAWSEMLGKMKSVLPKRVQGKIKSPLDFIDFIDDIPEEQIVTRLFRNNIKGVQAIRENLPDVFDALREARFQELGSKVADINGEVSISKFIRVIRSLDKAEKSLLFGEDALAQIKNIETIKKSFPDKVPLTGFTSFIMNGLGIPILGEQVGGVMAATAIETASLMNRLSDLPKVNSVIGQITARSFVPPIIDKAKTEFLGYKTSSLIEVPQGQEEMARSAIMQSEGLSSVEKSKQIQLLNKYGALVSLEDEKTLSPREKLLNNKLNELNKSLKQL